ncbi:MAG: hypothetical protein RLY71_3867 [Pseudomonadota bacterium]
MAVAGLALLHWDPFYGLLVARAMPKASPGWRPAAPQVIRAINRMVSRSATSWPVGAERVELGDDGHPFLHLADLDMTPWLDLLRLNSGAAPPPAPQTESAGHARVPVERFFAQGSLPLDCLALAVEGLGEVHQPLPSGQAQALHALSEPAHFGLRDQTLLDTTVRHTGEVDADLIDLQWQPGAFAALQREVAQAFGLETLDAWLHKLLIYGPGQFFKPHQDTERLPGMVATLVLVWPSAHIGGELRVSQRGQPDARLASQHLQARALRWFAFYADCPHEVLPVEEGWRVVLTFDLVVPRRRPVQAGERPNLAVPAGTIGAEAGLLLALQAGLRQQFEPVAAAQDVVQGDAHLHPWVLLLDHEYTEHGLRWSLLKGEDRWRVGLLRGAAEALGLVVHLALAELHENWSAEPVVHTRKSRGGRTYDEAADEIEPGELLYDELSLDFWVDAHDRVEPGGSLAIRSEDVHCFIETGDAHLVNEEYEGYMGNYGETVDYWYRRAALVIRSPLAQARDRFTLDFDGALAALRQLAREPEQITQLAALVQAAAATLARQASSGAAALQFDAYAETAAALPDGAAATALLTPFDPRSFGPGVVEDLARLGRARGADWLLGLFKVWYAPDNHRWGALASWQPGWHIALELPRFWPQPLPALVQAAGQAGWPPQVLDAWLDACAALLARFHQAGAQITPLNRLTLQPGLLGVVVELAQALVVRGAAGERGLQGLIAQVLAQPQFYPPHSLRPLVAAIGAPADAWPAGGAPLRAQVIAALQARLAEPERGAFDHSLRGVAWTCRCADCAPMIAWAESPSPTALVLAMAEQRRNHVQERFTAAAAPLSATTLRQGSPYKLVLAKPGDLHGGERAVRAGWARDLAALEGGG